MSDMSRRDAVKLAAGLAIGAGVLATQQAPGQEPKKGADPQPPKPAPDPMLESAFQNPEVFMFAEQVTFKTSTTDPHTEHLTITPIQGSRNGYDFALIPAGSMRIFRADAGKDDFTKKGGLYWKCGKTEGKFQFQQPGALVLAVRDLDGTVRCYSLALDFRC